MATARSGATGNREYLHREVVPFAAMVSLQCIGVGLNTLYKLAANDGMSRHVFIAYAYAVAALLLLPSPFLSRRSRDLPPFNCSILLKILLLGAVGYACVITGFRGIEYTSPTLASAISNLSPAFTFVLATIFRMEKLELSCTSTWAKLGGTMVSILGAFVVTFYKGPSINAPPYSPPSLLDSSRSDWIIGSIFLTVEYLFTSLWYIILTHIMKVYPSEFTIIFFYTFSVSIMGAIVGFFAESDSTKWIIKPNIALASMLCSGIFNCLISNSIDSWILHLRGPVYVAMFKPLSIVVAAAMGVIILGDTLYLGSIIGAMIIVIGFYTVTWAKAKEELRVVEVDTSHKLPLLQNGRVVEEVIISR